MVFLSISVPIIIDTQIQAVDSKWNHDGTILAICGIKLSSTERDSNIVMFYSPFGVVSIFFSSSKYVIYVSEIMFSSTASSHSQNTRT